MLLEADGVIELKSSAGAISIGNDAVAQNINIGTGASSRIINIGFFRIFRFPAFRSKINFI